MGDQDDAPRVDDAKQRGPSDRRPPTFLRLGTEKEVVSFGCWHMRTCGQALLSGLDGTLRSHQLDNGRERFRYHVHASDVEFVATTRDDRFAFSVSTDCHLVMTDLAVGTVIRRVCYPSSDFREERPAATAVDVDAHMSAVLVGGHSTRTGEVFWHGAIDRLLQVSDPRTGAMELKMRLGVSGGQIWDAYFSPSCSSLAIVKRDTKMEVWDVRVGRSLCQPFDWDIKDMCFAPDGSVMILSGGLTTNMKPCFAVRTPCRESVSCETVWEIPRTMDPGPIWGVGVSPCGQWMSIGTTKDELYLWRMKSGLQLVQGEKDVFCRSHGTPREDEEWGIFRCWPVMLGEDMVVVVGGSPTRGGELDAAIFRVVIFHDWASYDA